MARYLYAATPADYVVNASTGLPVPGAVVTVWTARTGGSQVTDLQTLAGGAITQVTADAQGFIAFYGPDAQNDVLWIYAGSGSRLAVRPVMNPTEEGSVLPLSGGTLTGALTLSGAPTVNLHAATKKYVDDNVAGFLPTSGGTMTGSLRVSQASAKVTGDASTYVFARRQGDGTGYGFHLGATSTLPISAALYDSGGSALTAALNYSTSSSRWNVTGNMYVDGSLTLNSQKISGLAAATTNGDAVRYEQLTALGTFAAWTPVLTASTSNPTASVTTGESRYMQLGKFVHGFGHMQITAAGGGTYRIPLPATPVSSTAALKTIGWAMLFVDDGTIYARSYRLVKVPSQSYCHAIDFDSSTVPAVNYLSNTDMTDMDGRGGNVYLAWKFDYEAA